jgi:hypothetical protein
MSLVFIFTRRTKIYCICVCSYFSDVPVREKFSIKSHKPFSFSFFLSTSGRFKILSAMQTPTYIIAKEKQKKFLFLLVWKEEFATRGQFVMKKVHKCFLLNLEVYSSNSSIPLCNRCFDISCNVIVSHHSPNQLRKPYYKFNQEIIKDIGTKTISIEFLSQSV